MTYEGKNQGVNLVNYARTRTDTQTERAVPHSDEPVVDSDVSALIRSTAWNHVFDKHTYGVWTDTQRDDTFDLT